MPYKHSYEFVKEQFEQRGYKLLSTEYINSHQKLEFICSKHPNEIMKVNLNHLMNGKGCKRCGYERTSQKLTEHKKTKFSTVIDFFKDIDLELVSTEKDFIDARSHIKFICPKHPKIIQEKTFTHLKHSPWCSICKTKEGNQKLKDSKISYSKVKKDYEKEGYKLITPKEEYVNCLTKITYVCPFHGEQKGTYGHFREGKRCPKCNSSKGEKEIRKILTKHNIDFEEQKKFENLKGKRNHYLTYDFYIPSLNTLIEYQGEFHDETMYKISDFISYENYLAQRKRDKIKEDYAKKHNINLIQIWYYDFKNIESKLKEVNII